MREVESLAERLKDGDKRALSKALTLAESVNPDHMTQLSELFRNCLLYTSPSPRD